MAVFQATPIEALNNAHKLKNESSLGKTAANKEA